MNEDGPIKFVGIMHNDREATQFSKLLNDLNTHMLYLGRTKASTECTLLAVNTSIINALLYRGNLATLTAGQYKELDLTIDRLYRKIHKMMSGTSQHILHMPVKYGGLGYTDLDTRLLCAKWATIHRNSQQLMVTRSLLTRAEKDSCVRYPGQSGVVQVPDGKHELWVGSMLRSARKAGLQLMKGGHTLAHTTCEQVYDLAHEMKMTQILPDSELHGMYTVGDFTEFFDGTRRWIREKEKLHTVAAHFELLKGIKCPQEPLVLRPAQCWLVQECKQANVYEILGFINKEIVVRKWITNTQITHIRRRNLIGQWVKVSVDSPSRGAGSLLRKTYKELFPEGLATAHRVILTPDSHDGKRGVRKCLHRVITEVVVDVPPTVPGKAVEMVHKIVADIIRAIGDDPGPLDFFTDGSWKKTGGPISSVFCPESVGLQASAGLVIIKNDDNWKELPMISVALTNGEDSLPGSVYPMELLGLSIALKVAETGKLQACFYSDSTAAIEAIKQPHSIRYRANKANLLLLKASTGKARHVQHVRAHPEKIQTAKSLWTRHMMGNHIADRTAVEDYTTINQLQKEPNITKLTYTVEDSLKTLTQGECYYWANSKGIPTLQTFQEITDHKRSMEYITERDEARKQRMDAPKWAGRSYQHAALCAELQHRNKGDRARLLRIMWDLYYHGGTQKKFDCNNEGLCNLCSLPDSAEHWMMDCRAGDINTPPLQAIELS
jgi:ribonuclease HI